MAQQLAFIGDSAAARLIREDIATAARSDAKVLITGETGVGKEVVAHVIHARSRRQQAPLSTLNCAGIPDTLLESELFGYERGSFTDACRDKRGILEAASPGTVFLDEVGEMSLRMQAVLLRFLESGEVQRVGADRARVRVDVRILAATNRDLDAEIAAGRFRQDLFYRLNVIRIPVPPLRERRADIEPLLEQFLDSCSADHRVRRPSLSHEARARLLEYRWPGNVRELRNVVERLVVRAAAGQIRPSDLPDAVTSAPAIAPTVEPVTAAARGLEQEALARLASGQSFWLAVHKPFIDRDLTRAQVRAVVERSLERATGNYRIVVRLLNMPDSDYKRFLRFLRQYGCQPPFRAFRTTQAA